MKDHNQEKNQRLSLIKQKLKDKSDLKKDSIFHIGQLLIEAKALLGGNDFRKWIESSSYLKYNTANSYMNVFKACKEKENDLRNIKKGVLYAISASNFPIFLRKMMLNNPGMLQNLSEKDVKKLGAFAAKKNKGLDESQMRKLIKLCRKKLRFYSYRTVINRCIFLYERFAKQIESDTNSFNWPSLVESGETPVSKNAARKINDLNTKIESLIEKLQPSVKVVSAKKLIKHGINYR